MAEHLNGIADVLYLILGIIIFAFAALVTMGSLFSSVVFGFGMVLLVDLPIGLGIAGFFEFRHQFAVLMALGCVVIVIYIGVSTYFSVNSGSNASFS